jgi:hypothetical protein
MNVDTTVIKPKEFYVNIPCAMVDMTSAESIAEALRSVADRIQDRDMGYGFGGYALDAEKAIVGTWGFS